MMNKEALFLIIEIINLIAAAICFMYLYKKEGDIVKAIFTAILMVLTLGFATVFFLSSSLFYTMLYRRHSEEVSYIELSFSKDRMFHYNLDDLKEAENKVPIEEAIIASNKIDSRKVLLNVLKEDYKDYLGYIYHAVESNDSEVSHYAASAIVEFVYQFKRKFEIAETIEMTEKEKVDFIADCTYFLTQNILSESDRRYYVERLEQFCEEYAKEYQENMDDSIIKDMVSIYVACQDYNMAKKWVDLIACYKLETIYTYKAELNYYFAVRSQEDFNKTLKKMEKSDIVLDNQLIELVRLVNGFGKKGAA